MKLSSISAGVVALAFAATTLIPLHIGAQDGPQSPSDSVAKPKKKPTETPEPDQQQIPSEYKKKDVPENSPTFRSDATTAILSAGFNVSRKPYEACSVSCQPQLQNC